ncbi:MAG: ribose 5-phosphate isomerase [Bacteroidetes bacterium]|uniref:ribose-5-phosphate isomerase RpiA n=1 Tax=Chitinophaga TaxID=79328 RepID=UPI001D783E7B|nr:MULTISPECIES: ribose-5-phosphate isomerase RpiA [Chitinophaga]MBP1651821.1 ribose 5-phosphate isomerase [Bacteroidota bacterium]WPQ64248.1 ribose-5-phosphate isomerase RpiA [Chitinophaga sancti]WPV68699.1 ribose-5-phosphate isomerase RpiA [Chitinophaga sp. LS1]
MDAITKAKKAAGEKAAALVQPGMLVGLGTGSTAYWAIEKIGQMVKEGLNIQAVATSIASEKQAIKLGIPITSFSEIQTLDLDIDGADEISEEGQLIKGGGGSLLREKIVALASRRRVIVGDERKFVKTLGKFPLPIEVVPFGWELVFKTLQALQGNPSLRTKDDQPYITDNSNYIIDCSFGVIREPELLHQQLKALTGVVETGLFLNLKPTVIIAYENGDVKTI